MTCGSVRRVERSGATPRCNANCPLESFGPCRIRAARSRPQRAPRLHSTILRTSFGIHGDQENRYAFSFGAIFHTSARIRLPCEGIKVQALGVRLRRVISQPAFLTIFNNEVTRC